MSGLSQVMQVGAVEGNIRIYMEDYAYTYLKKQNTHEKNRYFLYGEREADAGEEKIYIYGIAEVPKLERSYFKEYYPIGYLRIQGGEKYWIDMKGKEHPVKGFFVFYAPNQAMQEYLIDESGQGQAPIEKEQELPKARRVLKEMPQMKETLVSSFGTRASGKHQTSLIDRMALPVGCALVAMLIVTGLTTTNGQKKLQIFKDVVTEVMSDSAVPKLVVEEREATKLQEPFEIENQVAGEAVIDEQTVFSDTGESEAEENNSAAAELTTENSVSEDKPIEEETGQAAAEDIAESAEASSETLYISYTVEEGDTLAYICQKRYGSTDLMDEICDLNNIKNPDHISPGQKLYLPNE